MFQTADRTNVLIEQFLSIVFKMFLNLRQRFLGKKHDVTEKLEANKSFNMQVINVVFMLKINNCPTAVLIVLKLPEAFS